MAKRRRQASSRISWLARKSSNWIGRFLVQRPPGERKSGMPHSVEMPAPVNGTIRSRALDQVAQGGDGGVEIGRNHCYSMRGPTAPAASFSRGSLPCDICTPCCACAISTPRSISTVNKLGLKETRRRVDEKNRYTLVFLAGAGRRQAGRGEQEAGRPGPVVELTYNWDTEDYGEARYFGHLAYEVDDIYATCERLMKAGVTINRPPRDGIMAFVRSPDKHSIELLQKGAASRRRSRGSRCPIPANGERTAAAAGGEALYTSPRCRARCPRARQRACALRLEA